MMIAKYYGLLGRKLARIYYSRTEPLPCSPQCLYRFIQQTPANNHKFYTARNYRICGLHFCRWQF